jgi:phospholipase/carboxylesterase
VLSGSQKLALSGKPPKQLVVFLHGYGADGANLIDIADYWQDDLPDAEFIAPNAPEPCDVNPYGYQWFGLQNFSPAHVRQGLETVGPLLAKYLKSLLLERHLSAQQLALVGFSQGTILALEMMFLIPNIRCIIGYSGAFYPPIGRLLTPPLPEVLLIHGDMDTVVPHSSQDLARQQLAQFNIQAHTHTCAGLGHFIDGNGIQLGLQFLTHHFSMADSIIYMDQK